MDNVVNLRRFRKQRARAESEKEAQARRAAFGRTKAERERSAKEAESSRRHIDGHKLNQAASDAEKPDAPPE